MRFLIALKMTKIEWPLEFRAKLDSVSKEILCYFGGCPMLLSSGLASEVGDASLNVGNGLVWVAGVFDPPGRIEEPLGTRPTTIHGLGKQFQVVGRRLLDGESALDADIRRQVHSLQMEVRTLRRMVLNGGAK